MSASVPPRSGVRRSRSGALLGGVCAGIARSAGLDPLLLRIAVVAVTLLTGGAGLLAYLAAWVLIPREEAPLPALDAPAATPVDVRTAWSTAGNDLRSLAGELRRSPTGPTPDAGTPTTGTTSPGTTSPGSTSPGTTGPAAAADTPAGAVPTGTGMPEPDTTSGTTSGTTSHGPDADLPPGTVPAPRSPIEAADDAATALGERLRAPEVQEGARRAATSVSQALAASVDELGRRVRRGRD